MNARRGFTLIELLVVLLIVSVVAAVTLPVVMTSWRGQRVSAAAQAVQGQVTLALAEAQRTGGISGLRFIPSANHLTRITDPASPAFGMIDPDAPLAYDRVVPIVQPPGYSEGKVAIYTAAGSYPTSGGFAPPVGALCLEQEPTYLETFPNGTTATLPHPPTAWAWNVRMGDKVELGNHLYTVCGPMAKGPSEGNPERFVNYDPAWLASLDRGDGRPREFLYLTNNQDDDGDGYADNGFDGLDNDHDGVVDGPAEWSETERWLEGVKAGVRHGSYTLRRRPVAGPASSGVQLAGALIDATTWAAADPAARVRSNLVVDPWTGEAELIVDASGRVTQSRSVGVPSADGLSRPRWLLWIADIEGVDAPPIVAGDARLLAIDARTGRTETIEADAATPRLAFDEAEGRGR